MSLANWNGEFGIRNLAVGKNSRAALLTISQGTYDFLATAKFPTLIFQIPFS